MPVFVNFEFRYRGKTFRSNMEPYELDYKGHVIEYITERTELKEDQVVKEIYVETYGYKFTRIVFYD